MFWRVKRSTYGLVIALAGCALMAGAASDANAEADGPDAWRVVDVAANDVLNARMGPGTHYRVIGQFAHDATGLQQITCVPLLPPAVYFELSEAEIEALPQRWCLMQSPDFTVEGWVAQRYIAPDHSMAGPPSSATATNDTRRPETEAGQTDIAQEGESLVRRLYDEHLRSVSGDFTSPLHPARLNDFFSPPLARSIEEGVGADPLFNAQDVDITDMQIALDGENPMFRGLITVNADFKNFGRWQRAVLHLRAENGAPRIIRIQHDGWTIE